jgi:hypothetical protein
MKANTGTPAINIRSFIYNPSSCCYKNAYLDAKELLSDVRVEKAIQFAHNNPALVYGEGTEEFFQ